jgi:hypothetical protein
MRISLKENIIFETFNSKKDMMQKILDMIIKSETNKILYKGNPVEINYKLMKKVILEDYKQKIEPDKVRNIYKDAIKSSDRNFCIIYKEN